MGTKFYLLLSFDYTFRKEQLGVNMCLRHVMIDGCKWLQAVASGFPWMHIHTYEALDRLRHIFKLHMHECLYLFMDEIECVIMWMLHMDGCLCTHIVFM